MIRKSIWTCAALAIGAFGFVATETASAGWGGGFGYSNYGNRGYSNSSYGYQRSRGYSQFGVSNRGYGSRGYGGARYHDTTHLDYHAPSINRHGNHYDYTPGHYDVHRSGHFHR